MVDDWCGEMLHIRTTTWSQVESFWEKHNDFRGKVKSDNLEMSGIDIRKDVFDFKPEKIIGIYLKRFPSEHYPSQPGILIGCVRIDLKLYGTFRIAALGKMAIHKKYRRNGLGTTLMEICCLYMQRHNFDFSILWASVLKLYRDFGYIEILENMMIKFFRNINKPIDYYLKIPERLGAW